MVAEGLTQRCRGMDDIVANGMPDVVPLIVGSQISVVRKVMSFDDKLRSMLRCCFDGIGLWRRWLMLGGR